MKRLLLGALLCALFPFAYAQEASDQGPEVIQFFSCKLNPGQNYEDVFSVLEALRDQPSAQTNPDEGFGLFLWVPFRAATDYDYIWGGTSSSLISAMEGMTSYMSSPAAALMAPRFQALNEHCDTSIAYSERVRTGSMPPPTAAANDRTPDALVETFSCQTRPGSSMSDVGSTVSYWQDQVQKISSPDLDKYDAWYLTPFRGGNGQVDFGWIGAYPDMVTFARGETAYAQSKEGQAANARFEKVSTCRSALWTGYWISAPGS